MNAGTAHAAVLGGLLRRRILLVTGKGGVGRTTVAAALARVAARRGHRALVLELGDPDGADSPLAQLFGRSRLGAEPAPLEEGLRGAHLWAPAGHERFLRDLLPGGALLGPALRSRALQTFLGAAPSFLEMGWLYHLLTIIRQRRAPHGHPPQGDGAGDVPSFAAYEHERIVIDLPATGHTLALATLPDILERLIRSGPVVEGLREGQAHLHDRRVTGAVVVTLPEALPVSESLELVEGLRASRIPIAGVVLNRVPVDPFSPEERAAVMSAVGGRAMLGGVALGRIERSHEAAARLGAELEVPVLELPELPQEGTELLAAMTHAIDAMGDAP